MAGYSRKTDQPVASRASSNNDALFRPRVPPPEDVKFHSLTLLSPRSSLST